MRTISLPLKLGLLVGVLIAALLPGAASAQTPTLLTSDASVASVACPAAGACVAVGSYESVGGEPEGLLLSEAAGNWTSSVQAPLPGGAGSDPNVNLTSVSCASVGSCTAVGDYFDGNALELGVAINLRRGVWRPGLTVNLPAGAAGDPDVTLNAVSCTAPGDCTAVGSYQTTSGEPMALVVSETNWVWGTGSSILLPAGASPAGTSTLSGVACGAPGDCSAVGWYADGSGAIQGLLVSSSGGGWGPGTAVSLPGGAALQPEVSFGDITCPAIGQCVAVGEYTDINGNRDGILVSQTSGVWGAAQAAPLPVDALAEQATTLNSVACTAVGYCTAVGEYTNTSQSYEGVVLTETAGAWSQGIEATLPLNAAGNQDANLNAVTCTMYETCVITGTYFSTHPTGLLLTEVAGRWKQPLSAYMPPGASGNPYSLLDTIACAPGGYCVAAGNYEDGAGNQQGVLMDGNGLYWRRGLEAPLPGGLQTLLSRRARHRPATAQRRRSRAKK